MTNSMIKYKIYKKNLKKKMILINKKIMMNY